MSAVDELFRRLRSEGKKAFLPFCDGWRPSVEFTGRLLQRLDRLGCSMAEVGVPYSDPIAVAHHSSVLYSSLAEEGEALQHLERGREGFANAENALVTMVSYAVIHRHGLSKFVDDAKQAGFFGSDRTGLVGGRESASSRSLSRQGF